MTKPLVSILLAVSVGAYVTVDAQLYAGQDGERRCLPLEARSEFGSRIYFTYLLGTSVVAFLMCIPIAARAMGVALQF